MKENIKQSIFSAFQVFIMATLVLAILLSPARTETVLPEENSVTYIEIHEDEYLYGQKQIQKELQLKIDNQFK